MGEPDPLAPDPCERARRARLPRASWTSTAGRAPAAASEEGRRAPGRKRREPRVERARGCRPRAASSTPRRASLARRGHVRSRARRRRCRHRRRAGAGASDAAARRPMPVLDQLLERRRTERAQSAGDPAASMPRGVRVLPTASTRAAVSTATGTSRRRRPTNSSARADGPSSHCRSSIATTTGCSSASALTTEPKPANTARGIRRPPSARPQQRDTEATRCGVRQLAERPALRASRADRSVRRTRATTLPPAGRAQHAEPCLLRGRQAGLPDRRLADTWLSDEAQARGRESLRRRAAARPRRARAPAQRRPRPSLSARGGSRSRAGCAGSFDRGYLPIPLRSARPSVAP